MKGKLIAFALAILLLVMSLAGCSSKLPSGKASRIDFIDGWSIRAAEFEYVNESTVKIIREDDGQVWYVPTSSIDMIWLED